MGRRRTQRVITRAINVYKLLLKHGGPIKTPKLFEKALQKNIVSEYSSLYQALKLLSQCGLIERSFNKGALEWEVIKVVENNEKLEEILSNKSGR
ncbi:MAG: hypothetical protein B6U94_01340 [Thermofilum sp. ex4484_79]|nr:MAG: hypothetical protein B6U94_01340 [Thermofilum sp. ex4484_79]